MEYILKIKIKKVESNVVHFFIDPNKTASNQAVLFRNILKMKFTIQPQGDQYKFIEDPYDDPENDHWVWIAIYSLDEFLSAREKPERNQDAFSFNQEKLKYQEIDGVREPIYPIVHISDTDEYWNFMCDDETVKLSYLIPRFFQIMDNSIWNYLVPLPDNDDEPNRFNKVFFESLKDIENNYKNELYSTDVAIEYADLSARQARESYLEGDGHASHVVPFTFHSETAIERMIDSECADIINFMKQSDPIEKSDLMKQSDHCRMRLLLVDDNAMNTDKKKDKSAIIKRLLQTKMGLTDEQVHVCMKGDTITANESLIFLIECVKTLNEAKAAMKEKIYDIVLLDYLLDSEGIERNYGTELLEDICQTQTIEEQIENIQTRSAKGEEYNKLIEEKGFKLLRRTMDKEFRSHDSENLKKLIEKTKDTSSTYKLGPRRKQFFIFISAYTTAVNERLLAQGLNRSERYWFIDTGACPTNTPQLFAYNLLQLMEKLLNDSGILRLSSKEILKFIIRIFIPKKDSPDNKSVRERARDNYHYLLSRHYYFHRMLDDVEVPNDYSRDNRCSLFKISGSVLVSNFMMNHEDMGGLLEHLIQLVHLTAFGTIRQWAEMWEEYIYIRAYFEKCGFKVDSHPDFKLACEFIEKYVYDLKRQQR